MIGREGTLREVFKGLLLVGALRLLPSGLKLGPLLPVYFSLLSVPFLLLYHSPQSVFLLQLLGDDRIGVDLNTGSISAQDLRNLGITCDWLLFIIQGLFVFFKIFAVFIKGRSHVRCIDEFLEIFIRNRLLDRRPLLMLVGLKKQLSLSSQ